MNILCDCHRLFGSDWIYAVKPLCLLFLLDGTKTGEFIQKNLQ